MEEDYKSLGMEKEYMQDVVIYNLNKFIEYCNTPHYFEYTHDFKQHKEVAGYLETLIKGYRELEKENKQLKEYIVVAPNLDEMTAVKYSHIQREAYFKGRAEEQQKAQQIIYEHYIPKSKVKELHKEYYERKKRDKEWYEKRKQQSKEYYHKRK